MNAKVMFRWGRAANEEARAKREARLVEIGDIKNIPVRSTYWISKISVSLSLFQNKIPFGCLKDLGDTHLSSFLSFIDLIDFFIKVGKISDVAANVSIGYQPEVNLHKVLHL